MRVVEIWFSPKNSDPQFTAELEDRADALLAALRKNGQICGEHVSGWIDGQWRATAYAADEDALATRFFSESAKGDLAEVSAYCSHRPVFNIVDDAPPTRRPPWRRAGSLYLFAHAFDVASPAYSGRDRSPVPLHLLPLGDTQRQDICSWQTSYRQHDGLWLDCGELEIRAYRQLADPASELSTLGRELCRAIEQSTGLPTYYYLMRHWGRKQGEQRRKCPLCGKSWQNRTAGKTGRELNWFDFRCLRCRLVSDVAATDEDERHASIGEYKRRRRRPSGRKKKT
jgi:predicted  nucleic acid-binding Zn ribbon protein